MKKSLVLVFAIYTILLIGSSVLQADPPVPHTANMNGKYKSLVQVLNCPGDRNKYGEEKDFGYWQGSSYCGQKAAPGYWVYVHPKWYVWKENTQVSSKMSDPDQEKAAVNGLYTTLIKCISCPNDRNSYGDFQEYGYWVGKNYCGQEVSSGWWVYVYPYWFIWQTRGVSQ